MHHKVHQQETPYQCNLCQKSFSRSDCLRKHEMAHGDKQAIHRAKVASGCRRSSITVIPYHSTTVFYSYILYDSLIACHTKKKQYFRTTAGPMRWTDLATCGVKCLRLKQNNVRTVETFWFRTSPTGQRCVRAVSLRVLIM